MGSLSAVPSSHQPSSPSVWLSFIINHPNTSAAQPRWVSASLPVGAAAPRGSVQGVLVSSALPSSPQHHLSPPTHPTSTHCLPDSFSSNVTCFHFCLSLCPLSLQLSDPRSVCLTDRPTVCLSVCLSSLAQPVLAVSPLAL